MGPGSSRQTHGVLKTNLAATLALAAFVVLGMTDGALGPLWPSMRDAFGRSDGHFGQIFAALAGGYMTASVASGHLTDRFGATAVIRTGGVSAAGALWWIGIGSSWVGVLLGFLVLGLGNGLLDASINAWVAVSRQQPSDGPDSRVLRRRRSDRADLGCCLRLQRRPVGGCPSSSSARSS